MRIDESIIIDHSTVTFNNDLYTVKKINMVVVFVVVVLGAGESGVQC